MKKRLIIGCICLAVLAFAFVALFSHAATRPTPSTVNPLASNESEIALVTQDDVQIAASFFPASKDTAPVILLLHGNGASRSQFAGHIGWLNEAGFSAMAIDFRGHGESGAHPKSFGLLEARDVAAAASWIKANRPSSKIGVIGVSLGGAAALLNEGTANEVDALILQAVYPDFDRAVRNRIAVHGGDILAAVLTPLLTQQSRIRYDAAPEEISPVEAAQSYKGSVLVIGGNDDIYTPPHESQELAEAFAGKQWLWLIDGLGHNAISDLNDEVYRERVLTFLEEEMGL